MFPDLSSNRTIMELKSLIEYKGTQYPVSSNRTIMELKYLRGLLDLYYHISSNRTIMELKCFNEKSFCY